MLGLSLPDVFNTLQIDLGSLYVNDFTLFGRTFRVTMQAENAARADPTNVSGLYVRNTGGGMVPLGTLGKLQPMVGPVGVALQHLWFRPDQRCRGSRLQFGTGDRSDATRRGQGPSGRLRL